ncbi:MAG TPA: LPXTG cell wall anchor domain-containing protein [Acidimicrobiales bacterium]|nr:LPXTG cell wall anchor domain-containing protein [Acidimicrobiales bacterium]
MIVVVAVATPALAHHPVLSGQVRCAQDGEQTVTWTLTHVTSENRSMVIQSIDLSRGTLTGFSEGQTLPAPSAPGSTVTGTSVYPGDATGAVILRVTGVWVQPDGSPTDVPPETRIATVDLVGTCLPPAQPAATIVPSCADHGALVTLTNPGGTATTFTILKDTLPVDTVAVPAGGSVTRTYPVPEGQTASFRATAPGGYDTGAVSVTIDCLPPPKPAATVVPGCTEGGAVVTLTNSGGKATLFEVFSDGASLEQVQVGPNETVTRTYKMAEDQAATFRATAPGYDSGPVPVALDCSPATRVAGVLIEKPTAATPTAATPTAVSASAAAAVAAAGEELPRTGTGTAVLGAAGTVLVALGTLLTRASRPKAGRAGCT